MVHFVDLAGSVKYGNGTYFGPKADVAKLKAAQKAWDGTVNANKPNTNGSPSAPAPRNSSFVEDVTNGVAAGKSRAEIAKELGLTPAELDARLASSGLQLTTDVNKNRETQSTEIIDRQTGEAVSGYYKNFEEGTQTSRTTDETGAEVNRTKDAEGKVTESVIDTDGVETKTITEPINEGAPIDYEVQPGDNLSVIAADHGIGLEDLQESNPGLFRDPRDPDLIYPGETVTIEDGTRTTVEITKDGHTVTVKSDGSDADVARKAIFEDGATVEQVAKAQGMTSAEVLKILEAAGIWIDKVEPTPGNGDVETTRIADPSTNVMVIESYDYQHDAATRTVIDERSTFNVPATDPQTGEVAETEVSGALGYFQNEVAKSAGLANSQIESSQDLIAQAQKRDPDAISGLRAEQKDAGLDVKIAGGKADSFTAAMQEAEADRLVAAAYDLVERSAPGIEAHNSAKAILGQALDYAGRVDSYADAVDANLTLLDAEKNLRTKDATRQQEGADLQKAFNAYKKEFLWGNVSPETRAQYERDGMLPGGYTSEAEVDKLLWNGFEDTLKQGEPAIFQSEGKAADLYRAWYKAWRAYNQANDGAMQARVDYTDGAITKADADLEFLRGEAQYLKGLQDQWANSNPDLEPSTSPYQQSIDATQTQIEDLSGQRGKLVNDEGYLHDKYMLTVPLHKRDLPQELSDVQFEYAKSHAQNNSAEIQNLQDRLGSPITGRDDDRVRDMVETMVAAMGPGGANVDIEKVVTQILRSPQINGDDPDHAGDLTIRPIAMGYFEAGVQMPTGLFEVTNRDGETHYVDLTGKIFDSKEEFLDDNVQFSENGIIVMPKGLDTGKGADDSIEYEAVQALHISGWDRVVDPIIAGGTAIASIASFIPVLTPVAAPIAVAGGAYFGTKAAIAQVDHLDNGGSWGDRESIVNLLSIATTALPMMASGLRGFALSGADGMSGVKAFAGGLGITRVSDTGLGSFGRYGRMLPMQSELSSVMQGLNGIPVKAAWGMDAAAVGGGAVLIGDTVDQLAAYSRGTADMSGLDLANAIVGLGTGIYGTAAGARGLRASQPFGSSAARNGSDFSSTRSTLEVDAAAPQMGDPTELIDASGTRARGEFDPEAKAWRSVGAKPDAEVSDQGSRVVDPMKVHSIDNTGETPAVTSVDDAQRAFETAEQNWKNAERAVIRLQRQVNKLQKKGETDPELSLKLRQAKETEEALKEVYKKAKIVSQQAEDTTFEKRVVEVFGWAIPEMQGEARFLKGKLIDYEPMKTAHAHPDGHFKLFFNELYALEVKNYDRYGKSQKSSLLPQLNNRHEHMSANGHRVHQMVVFPAHVAENNSGQLTIAAQIEEKTAGKVGLEEVFFFEDKGTSVELHWHVREGRNADGTIRYEPHTEILTPPLDASPSATAVKDNGSDPASSTQRTPPYGTEVGSPEGSRNAPKNLSAAFHPEGSELPRDPNAPAIPAALRSSEDTSGEKPGPIDPATDKALQENLTHGPEHLAMRTDPAPDPSQIRWSKAEKIEPRTREQLEGLTLSEVESLAEPQISAVPGVEMGLVSPGKFRRFTPEQFTWMSGQWDSLTVQQLLAFRKTHGHHMTPDQKATVDLVLQSARARELQSAAEIFNPMGGSSYMLWNALPPDWLAAAAGVGFAWRGSAFVTQALFPKATAPHTKLGRFLNGANGISFIATSPGSAAPFLDNGIDPAVNGSFTLGNSIFGTKSTYDAMGARSTLGFAGDYIGNVAYLGGSALYTMQNLDSPLATTAGTIFTVGSAEFLASAIRKNNAYRRDVPRVDKDVASASKADKRWALLDRIALGAFGIGMGVFAYTTLNLDPDDEAPKNGEPSAPVDLSPEPEMEAEPDREEDVGEYSQLVVTADEGLNLRAFPKQNAEIVAILQPDTFVQQTGQPIADAEGSWVPVEGYATDGSRHQGWVVDEYTLPHLEGARTSRGRINPELELNGYQWIEVESGQTLGGIARNFERDTAETVVLNLDHIADPMLLFEGDRIYLPVA
ncbi:LysM peptidoglycan-binding domain-containing protein [Mesorhizobium sp. YR577]|uniref:LysM peptidoglycan-binding domain-containing protein n=1 Tax=Mesorhizobium sp. YR577 TaxID=1884373 RepID=UPI0008EB959D|nr:LysM peptidoglycan-binding domain-containing protein [Mesorhizobium sp. YR577]SFU22691.1 LysM domain-containing protein [Mesorhizobium sp. YR577]